MSPKHSMVLDGKVQVEQAGPTRLRNLELVSIGHHHSVALKPRLRARPVAHSLGPFVQGIR